MSELILSDQRLEPIAGKVRAGERLSFEDGVQLYRSPDLLAVGWLANYVREKKHGNVTYYNVNRHINPTNICVAHCKLCAFGRDPNAPGRLHIRARRNLPARRSRRPRRRHRISHRRRPASRSAVRLFSRTDQRPEKTPSARAPESLHDGRSPLLCAHRQAHYRRNVCKK